MLENFSFDDTQTYDYMAYAFTKLKFYLGACTIDGLGYDIVIVDEAHTSCQAYTVSQNLPVFDHSTLKLLNAPPAIVVFILESYAAKFPNALQGRISNFLNGYRAFIQQLTSNPTTHDE
jgi:hypothetical protein